MNVGLAILGVRPQPETNGRGAREKLEKL